MNSVDHERENSKVVRVLMILSEALKFNNYFRVEELAELYEVSKTTIKRDFAFIEEHGEFVQMKKNEKGQYEIKLLKKLR